MDTTLGELLCDRLNVLQTCSEVPFDTCPVNEEIYDNVGFLGRHRKFPQAFPDSPGIYARKIRDRIELAVIFALIASATKMDPVLRWVVHVASIGHPLSLVEVVVCLWALNEAGNFGDSRMRSSAAVVLQWDRMLVMADSAKTTSAEAPLLLSLVVAIRALHPSGDLEEGKTLSLTCPCGRVILPHIMVQSNIKDRQRGLLKAKIERHLRDNHGVSKYNISRVLKDSFPST